MQGFKPIARGLWALGMAFLVGCRTLDPAPDASAVDAPPPPLGEEETRFAEVLARYARGLIHDFHQEPDAALTNYLQAVELDPSNQDLHLRIARGLLQQRRTDEAVQIMESLVRREPKSNKALSWMALIYLAADRPGDAEATYRRLIALDPEAAEAHLEFAAFYLRDGRRDEAREVLRDGVRKAREPLELHRALAATLVEEAAQTEDEAVARALREEALEQYRRAVRIKPDDARTLVQLGSLTMLNGDLAETLAWYRKVEELAPRDLGLRRRLALSFEQARTPADAVAALGALAGEADPAQVHYYLGEVHESRGEIDEAVAAFQQACRAARKDPQPVLRLALMQIQHQRLEQAGETLREGLERIPDHAELTTMLAFTYLDRELPEEALGWFARAEALRQAESEETRAAYGEETDHARFYYNYAKAAVLAGRTDEAIGHLSRVLDHDVAYLRLFMFDLLREEDPDTDRALSFFEAFARAAPQEPAAYYCLGIIRSYREDYEGALADLKRTLTISQTHHRSTQLLDEDFYFAYGAAHERTGRHGEAEALFRKALGMDPDHANTLNYLAYMWAERGENLDEAMTYIEKAVALDPDSGAFLDTLGWVHYQQGDFEAALREIERARALVGDDPVITDHLGDVLLKLDREAEALEHWKRAYRLDPEVPGVADKLRARGVDLEALREAAETEAGEAEAPESPPSDPSVPETDAPAEAEERPEAPAEESRQLDPRSARAA
jgi:tetratricopeptide (TPR) repeat protein